MDARYEDGDVGGGSVRVGGGRDVGGMSYDDEVSVRVGRTVLCCVVLCCVVLRCVSCCFSMCEWITI